MGALTRCAGHCAIGPKKLDMAWQLIYTSASRSLEAGRSGFGTVARHRSLSPLLVSAIERISQFSRLPGTDADRVIYCHRIVAVAGGRFHVLSAIRDAGADYTGRTNHIAHHLIIDPKEVAQLGTNGPSPAEVMLAMHWATSWNETPRFFEDSEEVKLSAIRPARNGSVWEQIAGSSDQAWLLANGDASRGAYIIQPLRVDLRAIYAESLRLMPDRLWQTSFTTSLQPSDEPADFRWIGVEESSPLRTRTESSGRPVLNLTAPDLLPRVEISRSAPVVGTRQQYPTASKPEPVISRTIPAGSDPNSRGHDTVAEPHYAWEPQYAEKIPITAFVHRAKHFRVWWFLVPLVLIVGTAVIWFGSSFLKSWQQRNQIREAIHVAIKNTEYFGDTVTPALIKDDDKLEIALRVAEAAVKSVNLALQASDSDLLTMLHLPDEPLKQKALAVKLDIPKEITVLEKTLHEIAAIYANIRKRHADGGDDTLLEELDSSKAKLDTLIAQLSNAKARKLLKEKIEVEITDRRAQQINALVFGKNNGMFPPQSYQNPQWFLEELRKTQASAKNLPLASDEAKTMSKVAQLVSDWEKVERAPQNADSTQIRALIQNRAEQWPEWLKTFANTRISRNITPNPPADTPAPLPSPPPKSLDKVPLFFVKDLDGLQNVSLKAYAPPFQFFYKQQKPFKEVMLTFSGDLLRSDLREDPEFSFDVNSGRLSAKRPRAEALSPPFCLFAVRTQEKEAPTHLFEIWVLDIAKNASPLFGICKATLSNDKKKLSVALPSNSIPGILNGELYLETPENFLPANHKTSYHINNLSIDLVELVKPLTKKHAELIQDLAQRKKPTLQTVFAQYELVAKNALKEDCKTSYEKRQGKSERQRCGGMLIEYGRSLVYLQLNDRSEIANADEWNNRGNAILDADFALKEHEKQKERDKNYDQDLKKKSKNIEDEMQKALTLVRGITGNTNLPNDIRKKTAVLASLESMIVLAGADTKRAKDLIDVATTNFETQRSALQTQVDDIASHPLLSGGVPSGVYRLLVGFKSKDAVGSGNVFKYPLLEFSVPSSAQKGQ